MSSRQAPPIAPSASLKVGAALDRCESLGQLLKRLAQSKAHYASVAPLLPPGLRDDVRAGPIDGDCWTLFAAHNPAAAKLRQMLPSLLQRLRDEGWQGTSIKVRVQPRSPGA
jgi:hypothetical protein